MTSTDRLAEMAAEIERQADPRDKLALAQHATLLEAMAEIERLRARVIMLEAHHEGDRLAGASAMQLAKRITELEALVTVGAGTMGTLQPDEPATVTHGHAPSAPPHDE